MLIHIVLVTVLGMAAGLVFKVITDRQQSKWTITWPEYIVGSLAVLIIVAPLVTWLGHKMAVSSQVTYHENWNGWESGVRIVKHTCSRDDGFSKHTYQGDPYQVTVVDERDKNGKVIRSHQETRYHTIPYASEEWDYVVDTTLGVVMIAERNFPPEPWKYKYRFLVSVPDIPSETGAPPFWTQVKERVEVQHNPGPVTLRKDYDNYILASHDSVLIAHSSAIEQYKKDGLLPDIRVQGAPPYYWNRFYGVGFPETADWTNAVARFNASLAELQGDLDLVVVDSNKVPDADEYSLALLAYWLSPQFGKDALSKNAILVILGTKDGKTVDWARAHTGMPRGNEALLLQIQREMAGKQLTPEAVLGNPTAQVSGATAQVTHSKGALEQLFWGQNQFVRVHMTKDGGFSYLLTEIKPTTGQVALIMLVGVLLSLGIWYVMFRYDLPIYFK